MTKTAYIGIFALLLMMFLVSILLDASKTDLVDLDVKADEPDESHRQPTIPTRGGDGSTDQDNPGDGGQNSGPIVDDDRRLNNPVPPIPADTPVFFTYTVQDGDICWNLARKFYGSGLKWEQIKKDNPALVTVRGDVVNIREGAKLRIRKTAPAPAIGSPAPSPQPRTIPPAPAGSKRYTVKDNDKLWIIARNFYGEGALWTKIRDANPGKVGSNGEVREGVTILIPRIR